MKFKPNDIIYNPQYNCALEVIAIFELYHTNIDILEYILEDELGLFYASAKYYDDNFIKVGTL